MLPSPKRAPTVQTISISGARSCPRKKKAITESFGDGIPDVIIKTFKNIKQQRDKNRKSSFY